MEIKRYAVSSIRSYKNALSVFLNAFPDKHPENISIHEIESFMHIKINQKKYLRILSKNFGGCHSVLVQRNVS
ncbi:phage integrase N-terminal SAM-like domain-containing protein [Thermoflavifilum thermophilum]|uniref:phage integrase N-terminal SAM-like domain-containing protein n=1 Tax=Thermoflavifilum thermophilum TaxID=1393122 RepID=UPI00373FD16B